MDTHNSTPAPALSISLISIEDPDPYVFGPPGSGSVIIFTDPDPYINKQKKVRKTLIYAIL
jgi:hypothetical protein